MSAELETLQQSREKQSHGITLTEALRNLSRREIRTSAVKRSIGSTIGFHFAITEKAPTRAFSWLKAATTAFTFKTLLRH